MAAVRFDEMLFIGYASIPAYPLYATMETVVTDTSGLKNNWRMFKITNNTNGDMIISFNDSTPNLFVPADSFVLYDCATNAADVHNLDNFLMQLGTVFSIGYSTAPTSAGGSGVWVEGLYAKN